MSVAEKAIVYASLILADDNVEITADNLATITKAANVQIDAIYFDLFAKALAGRNISDMLMNVGSAAAAPAAAAPAAGDAGAASAAAEAAAPEPEEESDDDMGFGLFD
ncbi:60S acidic ribosomal protein P1-alpha 1 [Zancudomyces culisetae]|uniref:60S acidic ribosomal protein P1-alpha 1 n=1 Tax=Zancudomyces culisetae TaxID=1213189 RepID=A0A1R1PUK3_ZANCU|nr:60S acidic ribosomal protein P1-alpha 1 [Zancudomyces culisetae]|eukprot:OMH84666.1 60S acidic ribosomal protein P1-alpha 1 [Zancudomyces culisetae]